MCIILEHGHHSCKLPKCPKNCLTLVAIVVTIVITIGMSVSSTIYLPAKVGFHVVLIYSNALDYYSLKLANAVVFMLLTVALSSVLVSKTENLSVS